MTPPLVVLNNFSQSVESHTKLMRVTFQHMFPTINIKTVKLSECRRVVLFHLMDDGNVEMRHYAVRANPVGVSKSVKRIIEAKLPDLGSLEVRQLLFNCIFLLFSRSSCSVYSAVAIKWKFCLSPFHLVLNLLLSPFLCMHRISVSTSRARRA